MTIDLSLLPATFKPEFIRTLHLTLQQANNQHKSYIDVMHYPVGPPEESLDAYSALFEQIDAERYRLVGLAGLYLGNDVQPIWSLATSWYSTVPYDFRVLMNHRGSSLETLLLCWQDFVLSKASKQRLLATDKPKVMPFEQALDSVFVDVPDDIDKVAI